MSFFQLFTYRVNNGKLSYVNPLEKLGGGVPAACMRLEWESALPHFQHYSVCPAATFRLSLSFVLNFLA